jgi:pyridoxine 5-phosphate synthase
MLKLGVNIDHVATLRQARYRLNPHSHNVEPHPLEAALAAEKAGAHGITAHLRADRRHMIDADIPLLRQNLTTKLNLELGNTPEIVEIVVRTQPEDACLVPENREEVTTEGGLDAVKHERELSPTLEKLHEAGIRVSLFIDPDIPQIDAALRLGAEAIELHTGTFANALGEPRQLEIQRLTQAAEYAHERGLQVNAGHGLSYENLHELFPVPHLDELNIGHSIISRAILTGMYSAVQEMLEIMKEYPGNTPQA